MIPRVAGQAQDRPRGSSLGAEPEGGRDRVVRWVEDDLQPEGLARELWAVLLPDLASQLRRQRGEACKCHDLAGCGLAGSRGKEFEAQIRCG